MKKTRKTAAKKRGAKKTFVPVRAIRVTSAKVRKTIPTLLSADLGSYLKERSMARVESNADPAWRRAAAQAIMKVAKERETFTADDVWATGLVRPPEPRALGPELASAERFGLIEATKDFKLTAQASRHRAPVRVWRSCVYKTKGKR